MLKKPAGSGMSRLITVLLQVPMPCPHALTSTSVHRPEHERNTLSCYNHLISPSVPQKWAHAFDLITGAPFWGAV